MAAFPTYDPASDTIRLNGSAVILLTVLMKSKFGERFDPETLFHPILSMLINQLHAAAGLPKASAGECFDRADLLTIAEAVFGKAHISVGGPCRKARSEPFCRERLLHGCFRKSNCKP